MRDEYAGTQAPLFENLRFCVWGEKGGTSYAKIGAALGLSDGAVRVTAHRMRRRYRDLLRQEVAHTVAMASEVDEELRYLINVVSAGHCNVRPTGL